MTRVKRNSTHDKKVVGSGSSEPSLLSAQNSDDAHHSLGGWAVLGLCSASLLLSLPLFAPLSFWPFGYVVFSPWLIAICGTASKRWAYLGSYLLGAAFFLFHFQWLYETTPEGYVAASLLYLALAFPAGAWAARHVYRRRGISLAIAFPVVWTGIEILRTYNPLGFPWFLLGHSQIRALPMVQIADLAGVYGVTFVAAMVNGLLADVGLSWWSARRKVPNGLSVGGSAASLTSPSALPGARRPGPGWKITAPLTAGLLIATDRKSGG